MDVVVLHLGHFKSASLCSLWFLVSVMLLLSSNDLSCLVQAAEEDGTDEVSALHGYYTTEDNGYDTIEGNEIVFTETQSWIDTYYPEQQDEAAEEEDEDEQPLLIRSNLWKLRDKISQIELAKPDDVLQFDDGSPPNLLFIVSDQLRFDALRFVQDRMAVYNGKLKINTPNIDLLAANGVSFETAYCVSPSCAPSRATLRTGCALSRAAIKGNKMIEGPVYKRMRFIEQAVNELETFEQVLVEEMDYTAETYGKWHVPTIMYYSRPSLTTPQRRIIDYNDYNFVSGTPQFQSTQHFKPIYQHSLTFLLNRDNIKFTYQNTLQKNYYSHQPYDPIRLDPRYGMPADTDIKDETLFDKSQMGNSNVCGRDSLGVNHTTTAVLGQMALLSLDRLINAGKPFSLSVHFNAPHPPMVATGVYLDNYWNNRANLLVSPSIGDEMRNSAYPEYNGRKDIGSADYGYNNAGKMAELTAVYYAMIEEVDHWVGELIRKINEAGLSTKTLIVFTSDHGDLLGAHGMVGKSVLLEEAARVPLVMSFPGKIPLGEIIREPASHMDVFATLLDYLQASQFDRSDGRSLRRYIDRTYYNEDFDDRIVVAEMDKRVPVSGQEMSRGLGDEPNFMIRLGKFKLLLPKKASSSVIDMMYNLEVDPYEINNLLVNSNGGVPGGLIGKAEHLKILLLEWLKRVDGTNNYYSNRMYNNNEGNGDVTEIRMRRTWRLVDFWISDQELSFGEPALMGDGTYIRNEYLYVGRTTQGQLVVTDISIVGEHAGYFDVGEVTRATISTNGYLRIKVSFRSVAKIAMSSLQASVQIHMKDRAVQVVKIVGEAEDVV